MTTKAVKVPSGLAPLFEASEIFVEQYFKSASFDPSKGTIQIGDERYILVRASSMSVHFFEFLQSLYPALTDREAQQATSIVLYDIAKNIGKMDAIAFHKAAKVEDPISKLSAGPIHFAYTGWAFVDISEESHPTPDENFFLLYDHPQSFEADTWINQKKSPDYCVCHMNAGYSAGWSQDSFQIELVSKEILCRAKGDGFCRFIMAQPHRVEEFVQNYKTAHPELFAKAPQGGRK